MKIKGFTADDYKNRVFRLREKLKELNLNAAFITPSSDLRYFTGLTETQSDRLHGLIAPVDGPLGFITPAFESSHYEALPFDVELLPWEEHEDPFALIARFVKGPLALSPSMHLDSAHRLMSEIPCHPGAEAFFSLRRNKEDKEIRIMETAIELTHEALDMIYAVVQEGMTETQIANLLKDQLFPDGQGFALVQTGPSSTLPHQRPGERVLKEGDLLLIDCGKKIHGYGSDITRSLVYGKASEKIRKVYNVVKQAQEEAARVLKPGLSCHEADHAARDVIRKAGMGANFVHRLGHGIGLDGHEPPYLVKNSKTILCPGDVMTLEPGVYLPNEFGVRIEDMVRITEKGAEIMGQRAGDLMEIDG